MSAPAPVQQPTSTWSMYRAIVGIGTLAFADAETMNAMRLGVISGSILSGLLGYAVLRAAAPQTGLAPARAV